MLALMFAGPVSTVLPGQTTITVEAKKKAKKKKSKKKSKKKKKTKKKRKKKKKNCNNIPI